jgi:uncharacterized protein YjbI with pentapeptide repeats
LTSLCVTDRIFIEVYEEENEENKNKDFENKDFENKDFEKINFEKRNIRNIQNKNQQKVKKPNSILERIHIFEEMQKISINNKDIT